MDKHSILFKVIDSLFSYLSPEGKGGGIALFLIILFKNIALTILTIKTAAFVSPVSMPDDSGKARGLFAPSLSSFSLVAC